MIQLPFELSELAGRFPNARANAPTARLSITDLWDIVRVALMQSRPYHEDRPIDWADDPSLQATMFFEAFLNGAKKRDGGGFYNSSHTWAVAYDMRFDPDLLAKGYNPKMLAVIGGAHDIGEAADKLGHTAGDANRFVAARCWIDDPGEKNGIYRRLSALTDSPALSGPWRLLEQEQRFRDPTIMDMVSRRARILDKINLVKVDAGLRRDRQLSDTQTLVRAQQAGDKFEIIKYGRDIGELPDRLMQRYVISARYLEQEALDITKNAVNNPVVAPVVPSRVVQTRQRILEFPAQAAAVGIAAILSAGTYLPGFRR